MQRTSSYVWDYHNSSLMESDPLQSSLSDRYVYRTPPPAHIDTDLWTWLNKDGYMTITFALGSHYMFNKDRAENLLQTFDALLKQRSDVRIYAKMMRLGKYDLSILEVMQRKWKGRLIIVEWMKADPIVILRTGKIGLAIHHGGSNSYHEALR